jgi:hypothetical protein
MQSSWRKTSRNPVVPTLQSDSLKYLSAHEGAWKALFPADIKFLFAATKYKELLPPAAAEWAWSG